MKKTTTLLFVALFIYPSFAWAQAAREDGWKNLKWGMTTKEVMQVYDPECESWLIEEVNKFGVDRLTQCTKPLHNYHDKLDFFEGKFYHISMSTPNVNKNNYQDFIKLLKERFPKIKRVTKCMCAGDCFLYRSNEIVVWFECVNLDVYSTSLSDKLTDKINRYKKESAEEEIQSMRQKF